MQNIIDIKNRIKSIKDTAQITKAMQLISVSKMRKADEKYEQNDRYYRRIKSTIKDIFAHTSTVTHPYLQHRPGNATAYIVIASDAGLAGDYNHRVLSFAENEIKTVDKYKIFTVGHIAEEFFVNRNYETDSEFVYCTQNPTIDDVRRLATTAVDLYDTGEVDEVRIIYTRHVKGHNIALSTRVVPIEKSDFDDAKSFSDYNEILLFEPSASQVFNILVPQYVLGTIFNALIESIRCEHSERMMAMNNATNNANDMIHTLELEYHRARQAKITSELSEMSSYRREQSGQNRKWSRRLWIKPKI
ncbi:MAG: ATP synthase F1 subunit gamma [Clostridia bacterium]|nr:ATP synthase F1 subunit gamma [Clostridia bacterium]